MKNKIQSLLSNKPVWIDMDVSLYSGITCTSKYFAIRMLKCEYETKFISNGSYFAISATISNRALEKCENHQQVAETLVTMRKIAQILEDCNGPNKPLYVYYRHGYMYLEEKGFIVGNNNTIRKLKRVINNLMS